MKRHAAAVLYGMFATLMLVGISLGQQSSTGIPPFSSWSGGQFDNVNIGNLNVHFSIPIVHKPGRGLPVS